MGSTTLLLIAINIKRNNDTRGTRIIMNNYFLAQMFSVIFLRRPGSGTIVPYAGFFVELNIPASHVRKGPAALGLRQTAKY